MAMPTSNEYWKGPEVHHDSTPKLRTISVRLTRQNGTVLRSPNKLMRVNGAERRKVVGARKGL